VGHVVAAVNPFEAEELAELRRATTDREYPLGQLPLIVLTRGRLDEEGPEAQAREREHRSDQERQARMSRSARLVVADNCGHHIQLERPELVVSIIREMLAELRGPAPAH
jgi:pimeloyl-ACP methyl ester carboxylesterase